MTPILVAGLVEARRLLDQQVLPMLWVPLSGLYFGTFEVFGGQREDE